MQDEAIFFVVMEIQGSDVTYLIVKNSDIGPYVVAKTYESSRAKAICEAFEKAEKAPPPF